MRNTPQAIRGRRFQPYRAPARPPAGTYDPGLDATQAAATRGYQDLQGDTAQTLERGSNDYNIASGERAYQTGNALADILRATQQQQADYGAANAERARQFGLQAQHQGSAINAAGLLNSGAGEQAAGIRGANQGREQSVADLLFGRAQAADAQDLSRTQHAGDVSQAGLDLNFNRLTADQQKALQRAGRENTFFGQDTNQARFYQAEQSGLYTPPVRPSSEHTRGGLSWRNIPGGVVLPSGRALTRAQFRALRARRGV